MSEITEHASQPAQLINTAFQYAELHIQLRHQTLCFKALPKIIIYQNKKVFIKVSNTKTFIQRPLAKLQNSSTAAYNIYFMRGTDSRTLPSNALKDFASMINADPFGHSLLVYNPNEALGKLRSWRTILPWITPYYAIKSNPIKPLLNDILMAGGSFDCASKGEIKLVLSNGVAPSKIVYSNPVKTEKDLAWAERQGVEVTTADTLDELLKIREFAPKMKILWRLSIQEENPELLATVFSGKFGDDIVTEAQAEGRFKEIKGTQLKLYLSKDLGFRLHGIHFHCGSAQQGSPSFPKAVSLARNCMQIGRSLGHSMELLDIGGGFPSGQLNVNVVNALSQTYNDSLGYRVIAEPGRHFSSNSCHLAFRILTKRVKQGKFCYHVNESLYHSFNCILMDGVSFENDHRQIYEFTDSKGKQMQMKDQSWCSLFGMTCDGRDVIASNIKLPVDMNVGDWIVMGGMGSYTYGPRSKFNGMKSTTKIKTWKGEMVESPEDSEVTAGLSPLNC